MLVPKVLFFVFFGGECFGFAVQFPRYVYSLKYIISIPHHFMVGWLVEDLGRIDSIVVFSK